MTAPGVNETSPATCFFCTYNDVSCMPLSENREQNPTLTYYIMECLAGSYNGKTKLNYEYV